MVTGREWRAVPCEHGFADHELVDAAGWHIALLCDRGDGRFAGAVPWTDEQQWFFGSLEEAKRRIEQQLEDLERECEHFTCPRPISCGCSCHDEGGPP